MPRIYTIIFFLLIEQISFAADNAPGWMMGLSLAGGAASTPSSKEADYGMSASEFSLGGLTPIGISLTGHVQILQMSTNGDPDVTHEKNQEAVGTLIGGEIAYHFSRFRLSARASTGSMHVNNPNQEYSESYSEKVDTPEFMINNYGLGLNFHLLEFKYFTWDLFTKVSYLSAPANNEFLAESVVVPSLGMGITLYPNWPSSFRSHGPHHHGSFHGTFGFFDVLMHSAKIGLKLTEIILRAAH